ncbi:MAG: glycosyltransferase family 4 protein, partial [Cyanobacteria bacterium P01_A01_bin.17]
MASDTVIFLSNWFLNNPYKRFLVQQLQVQGIEIELKRCSVLFLPKVLKSGIPKALHFHMLHSFLLARTPVTQFLKFLFFIAQLLVLKLLGVRLIWTVHEWTDKLRDDRQNVPSPYAAVIGRCLNAIICHCVSTQREIEQVMRLPPNGKAQVIPHGHYIDAYDNQISSVQAREKLGIPPESTVFLLFGSIYRYKGVVEAIDAFKSLFSTDHEAILLIAGSLKEADLKEEIDRKMQGCQNIRFIDQRIPEEEVQVYMNASDCVVTPYQTFTTSGVAVLVMSFARACIAPRIGFFEDILDDTGAIFYDSDSPAGLRKAMKSAIDAKEQLLEMGKHNLAIAQQWDWKTIAEKT